MTYFLGANKRDPLSTYNSRLDQHHRSLKELLRWARVIGYLRHFEDHIENGEMIFDYRLRDGVIRKSNAIELMRAIGLKV